MKQPSVPESQADKLWSMLTIQEKEQILKAAHDTRAAQAEAAESKLTASALQRRHVIRSLLDRSRPLTIGSSQHADAHPGDGLDIVVNPHPSVPPTVPGLAIAWIPVPLYRIPVSSTYRTKDGNKRTSHILGQINIQQSYATAPFYAPGPPSASVPDILSPDHPMRILNTADYSLRGFAKITMNPAPASEVHDSLGALEEHLSRAEFDASDDPRTLSEPAFSSIPGTRSPGSLGLH